jgi:hypothetical protein
MTVYQAIALHLPPWAVMAIDKLRQGFLWEGREQANGELCLIVCLKLCWQCELEGPVHNEDLGLGTKNVVAMVTENITGLTIGTSRRCSLSEWLLRMVMAAAPC